MLRILFLASEVAPFSKTGGLADVAHALPRALADAGHTVHIITPRYRSVPLGDSTPKARFALDFPFGQVPVAVHTQRLAERLECVFIDAPSLSDREGLYGEHGRDYPDNARRFAIFSMGALTAAQALQLGPDIVHCNDWQTGLVPAALRTGFAHVWPAAKSVLSIHNLAYQGIFERAEAVALGLPAALFTLDGYEFWGKLSLMKGGLRFADQLTTVSPTYAAEIQTDAFGAGLEGVLRHRNNVLTGILNGLDTQEWNPATDPFLPARFTAGDVSAKEASRRALIERGRLQAPSAGMPVFGALGRMVEQKGVDLMQAALPPMLEAGARVVVLGSGDVQLEQGWRELAKRYPHAVHVTFGFDDLLAHLIQAGSDFFLMPSRFEPCGLTQMAAMAYGTLPIVHSVGGLKDTVVDASEVNGTGIAMPRPTVDAMRVALERALKLYRQPPQLEMLRKRAMGQEFSWAVAADQYVQVYRRTAQQP